MALNIPARVAANCRTTREGAAWLDRLPETLDTLERRWSLTVGAPFDNEEVSCAWVAPVALLDGTPAVLKLGMPHMEAPGPFPTRAAKRQPTLPGQADDRLRRNPDSVVIAHLPL